MLLPEKFRVACDVLGNSVYGDMQGRGQSVLRCMKTVSCTVCDGETSRHVQIGEQPFLIFTAEAGSSPPLNHVTIQISFDIGLLFLNGTKLERDIIRVKTVDSVYNWARASCSLGGQMNVNRLALIAQILSVVLIFAVLVLSEIQGGIVVPGWGGAGP